MRTIRVVAAIIRAGDRIFATARGYGDLKGGWEFPGGKIEVGEPPQEALKREILEELDTEISVGGLIDTIEYDWQVHQQHVYLATDQNHKCYRQDRQQGISIFLMYLLTSFEYRRFHPFCMNK